MKMLSCGLTLPEELKTMKASMPIRCVVEHVNGPVNFDNAGSGTCEVTAVEQDAFAILPVNTPLCDLVRAALARLGYSASDAVNAKGAIQLKNWKPLSFDVITDDKEATIDDILRELKEYTLRIRLAREVEESETWGENSVRCAVLSLLKHHSQSSLAKLSPLSQSTISTIANSRYKNRLSLEKCKEFGQWYASFVQDADYPMTSSFAPPDSRMTFHPEHELPLLRSWYKENPCPTSDKFVIFAYELNSGHIRQDRPKVTPKKIKVWWKNERQREKRQQQQQEEAEVKTTSVSTNTGSDDLEHIDRSVQVKSRKRSKSSAHGSRLRVEVCSKTEETMLDMACESQEAPPRKEIASQDWSGKPDRDSQLHSSPNVDHDSSFMLSLSQHASERNLPHKQVRKSVQTVDAFSSTGDTQGQGHMMSPGPPSSSWSSSFMAWSNQRRSPELRDVNVASPEPGQVSTWPHHRLPVLFPQRPGSRVEGEREVAASAHASSAHVTSHHAAFGSGERYRYTHPHDLPFPPSSSSSMDFSNIL